MRNSSFLSAVVAFGITSIIVGMSNTADSFADIAFRIADIIVLMPCHCTSCFTGIAFRIAGIIICMIHTIIVMPFSI